MGLLLLLKYSVTYLHKVFEFGTKINIYNIKVSHHQLLCRDLSVSHGNICIESKVCSSKMHREIRGLKYGTPCTGLLETGSNFPVNRGEKNPSFG